LSHISLGVSSRDTVYELIEKLTGSKVNIPVGVVKWNGIDLGSGKSKVREEVKKILSEMGVADCSLMKKAYESEISLLSEQVGSAITEIKDERKLRGFLVDSNAAEIYHKVVADLENGHKETVTLWKKLKDSFQLTLKERNNYVTSLRKDVLSVARGRKEAWQQLKEAGQKIKEYEKKFKAYKKEIEKYEAEVNVMRLQLAQSGPQSSQVESAMGATPPPPPPPPPPSSSGSDKTPGKSLNSFCNYMDLMSDLSNGKGLQKTLRKTEGIPQKSSLVPSAEQLLKGLKSGRDKKVASATEQGQDRETTLKSQIAKKTASLETLAAKLGEKNKELAAVKESGADAGQLERQVKGLNAAIVGAKNAKKRFESDLASVTGVEAMLASIRERKKD